jgi:hypothetical protein
MISVINGYAFLFFVEGKVLMTFRWILLAQLVLY